MEITAEENLKFANVWERVSSANSTRSSAPSMQPTESILSAVKTEAEKEKIYNSVAARTGGGKSARLLMALSSSAAERRKMLRCIYYLLCGEACPANDESKFVCTGTVQSMRKAYLLECESADSYEAAATGLTDKQAGAQFSDFQHEASENARKISEYIAQIIT